jgi:hypothetical protein
MSDRFALILVLGIIAVAAASALTFVLITVSIMN